MEELGLNNPSFVFWLMVFVGIQNLREAMAAGSLSRKLRDFISSQLGKQRVFAFYSQLFAELLVNPGSPELLVNPGSPELHFRHFALELPKIFSSVPVVYERIRKLG